MKKEARKKLAKQLITWKEGYTPRSEFLKEQFEAVVGPHSYYRWEGKNRQTGDEYYVVVSPYGIHKPKAVFFAGVRKLPSDYPPYGEQFDTIKEAVDHAHEHWGIQKPVDIRYYTAKDLKGIDKKIKEWKKERAEKKASFEDFNIMIKQSMARVEGDVDWQKRAADYDWLNIKNIIMKTGPDRERFLQKIQEEKNLIGQNTSSAVMEVLQGVDQEYPDKRDQWDDLNSKLYEGLNKHSMNNLTPIERVFKLAVEERRFWSDKMKNKYGVYDPVFYQMWMSYRPEAGIQSAYLWTVGPHVGAKRDDQGEAIDTFDIFRRRLDAISDEEISAARQGLYNKIMSEFFSKFTPEQMEEARREFSAGEILFNEGEMEGHLNGKLRLSKEGRGVFDKLMKDFYMDCVKVKDAEGRTFVFASEQEAQRVMGEMGIEIAEQSPFLPEEIRTNITNNKPVWKTEIQEFLKNYNAEWKNSYKNALERAQRAGHTGKDAHNSPEVKMFLDTVAEIPIYNPNKLTRSVGVAQSSSPVYKEPAYPIKKDSRRLGPNLNGERKIFIEDIKDLQSGDRINILGKVFVFDEKGDYEKYEDGARKRAIESIPGGVISEINPQENSITLEDPISYDQDLHTKFGFNVYSVSVEKQSGAKKEWEFRNHSLLDCCNMLKAFYATDLEIPSYTRDIPPDLLREMRTRKQQNLPPPEIGDIVEEYEPYVETEEAEEAREIEHMEDLIESGEVQPVAAPETPEELIPDDFQITQKEEGKQPSVKEELIEMEEEGEEEIELFTSTINKLKKMAGFFEQNQEPEKAHEIYGILKKHSLEK